MTTKPKVSRTATGWRCVSPNARGWAKTMERAYAIWWAKLVRSELFQVKARALQAERDAQSEVVQEYIRERQAYRSKG